MRIAVVGLGKLGAVIAAIYAASGHEVRGVDLSADAVDAVNRGSAPVSEPGLADLIVEAGQNLSATTSTQAAVADSDLTFVIVPTPSDETGRFSNAYLVQALQAIGEGLRDARADHTVVISSTVMPGSCQGELVQALESSSGRVVGHGLNLVYSPEFIALGSVIRDMRFPDLVLVGESHPGAARDFLAAVRTVVRNEPKIHVMNLVNAEVVKIAINTYVTTKISFANMIGEICAGLEGGDAGVVTDAIGADSRIGKKYLKPALGYGGPCFPRDNLALGALAADLGVEALLAESSDSINRRQPKRIVDAVQRVVSPPARVALLGLAYKAETSVCEASQGIIIARLLADLGFDVHAFDPEANSEARPLLHPQVALHDHIKETLAEAQVVVVATPWEDFRGIKFGDVAGTWVIDPWEIMDESIRVVNPNAYLGGKDSALIS